MRRQRQDPAETAANAPPSPRVVNPPLPEAWQPPQPTIPDTAPPLSPALFDLGPPGPLAAFIDPVPPTGAQGEAHNWTMIPPVRRFYIDNYGADSTGLSPSDNAWRLTFAAAAAQLQAAGPAAAANGGVMIMLGAGVYQFSPGVVTIPDERIGLAGQGAAATRIFTAGSNGIIVDCQSLGLFVDAAAPIRDFSVDGSLGGAGITGLRYGDRRNGMLTGVTATNCSARGFWFNDSAGISEGSYMVLNSQRNAVNYDQDACDLAYSRIFLHSVGNTAIFGGNHVTMRVINGSIMTGTLFHMAGNITAITPNTATALQIGTGGSDAALINRAQFNWIMEQDGSTGTVLDMVVNTTAAGGFLKNNGVMSFGTGFSAGSVTGGAVNCAGFLLGPLFSSHGVLTALGTGGALSTYAG